MRRKRTRHPHHHLLRHLASLLALLLALASATAADAKGLNVTLKARWEGTSFVLETAEFLVRNLPM
jgi:hypothetical protein